MNNLEDFQTIPDEELSEIQAEGVPLGQDNDTSGKSNKPISPVADFFNSAGNTKLEDEEADTKEADSNNSGIPNSEPPKGKVVLGKLISGKMAANLINIFIPAFIVFSLTRLGYKSEKKQFKLTQEEKEIMTPVLQDCMEYIVLNFDNPFYALAFIASMIYGAKIFDAIPELSKMKDEIAEDIDDDEMQTASSSRPRSDVQEKNKNYAQMDRSNPVQRNNKDSDKYKDVREKILATSIRRDKVSLIVNAIIEDNPSDLIEMFNTYGGIFPERNENYFREWYERNYEAFPEHLKFNSAGNSTDVII